MKNAIESLAVFGNELLTSPGPIGAAVPSSRALARRIASCVPADPEGYVVELGAGTGAVTSALLERGLHPERIIPVELSSNMARHLSKRFPSLNVLDGDAATLRELLSRRAPQTASRISHVVSSLPLRSMPVGTVARIAREIHRLLPPEGTLIQFTYHLACRRYRPFDAFQRLSTSIIWLNFPPARVDVFQPIPQPTV